MPRLFLKILNAIFCLALVIPASAQVSFYAEVSPKEIGKSESFTYRMIVNNSMDIHNVTAPSFDGFEVLSGPASGLQMQTVNGVPSQTVSIEYTLAPAKPGKYTIGKAIAVINGKVYKSNPVKLIVSNQQTVSRPPSDPFNMPDPYANYYAHPRPVSDFADYIYHKGDSIPDKINKNMEFRAEVSKTSCYVGEPVMATYKLFTRLRSESKLVHSPSFAGFSVVPMPQNGLNDDVNEKLNGKEYRALPICKAQLYALQPGTFELETAELETQVQFIKEEYANRMAAAGRVYDNFPNTYFPPDALIIQRVTFKNKPVSVTVKPLPDKGKPADFKGAVGAFTIQAYLQKPLFSTDETGKLTVEISGKGNMPLLTAPEIYWPQGIESFDPKLSDNLQAETVPVSGTKKFEYSFAANDTGHFTLPSISFSYFDPEKEQYRELTTAPIVFQVTKGTGRAPDIIQQRDATQHKSENTINNHRWLVIVVIGVIIFIGLIIWLLKEKKQKPQEEPVASIPVQETYNEILTSSASNQQNVFAEAAACLERDECRNFYGLLNTELKKYLADKFQTDIHVITQSSVITLMDKRGISNDTILKLQELMQEIEWQLYTPFERNEQMKKMYDQAQDIVQLINTYDIKRL